ncbi:MAG TPA: tRNA pseudouridine(55) synthase TruB [Acidiphilium sp.]|nr:MAG: tRNA pseudouridine(55) synthase TruB [Acidiphilium sp. 21-60-14]OYV89558.1 MAG: tRNA pseudouridine(55) synthase TruB [Acidiphilium sp. 37-60-79]OZB38215.1 MAG: tRNA pseudouridine(55) synthase TruB [Acidiphilium sp. 34-60-192]HQT88723.1 tRNA pseudouridine(55) synthase TruB [Acidiphilium sp.]HQU23872.1 tRNA pseudouridine(55) synthase TruB [Acidiphilium sp.]
MGRPQSRQSRGRPIDGWIILDKPQGITSAHAVARIKRILDAAKVGHGGTLDPLATGLLPIALGAATKTVPYIMDGTKLYRFTLKFGEARDSDDADGAVVATSDVRPDDAAIRAALGAFRGTIMQVPPAFSAIKVNGERAYDLARQGAPPELAARPAQIDRFDLVERPDADHAIFDVASGKGVYMRALARDLAHALGTVGHIAVLRRLAVGPFTIEHGITLDKLADIGQDAIADPNLVLSVTTALADIPALAVTSREIADLKQGLALSLVTLIGRIPEAANPEDGLVRLMAESRCVALGRMADGLLRTERFLQP